MSAKRVTILQIVPRLDAGGAELTTLEMTQAIVAAGARAIVMSAGGRLVPGILAAGGEHITAPVASKNPAVMLANARRIAGLLAREGVDLVHARSRAPAWSAYLATRRPRVPFVTTYHGIYRERGKLKRLYNGVMASGDTVIANSTFTADLVLTRYATPPSRIAVIPRGVDIERFDPANVSADRIAALRAAWNIPPGRCIVLHPARLTAWKGQPVAIDALAALVRNESARDAVLVLAGEERPHVDYGNRLRAQIAARGLERHVHLAGHVGDMPAAFAAATVTVVASTEPEAFGRAAIEAQAMRCPVVATRLGAAPETVLAPPRVTAGARTGWLVPPSDPTALAAALGEALALPPHEREAFGTRARAHVLATYTTHELQRRTLLIYDRHLGTALAARFDAAHADGDKSLHRPRNA